jgi:peptidoglycan hydrolase CwlO-like protein
MNLKLIVGILLIAAVPAVAQTQKPNVTKVTKAGAQKVIKTISSDKGKNQTYCDIGKLGAQIDEAEQKKDMKRIDELNQKMEELATKLGPEYVALMDGLQDIDPDSKDAQEIGSMLEALDKSCAK